MMRPEPGTIIRWARVGQWHGDVGVVIEPCNGTLPGEIKVRWFVGGVVCWYTWPADEVEVVDGD